MRLVVSSADGLSAPLRLVVDGGRREAVTLRLVVRVSPLRYKGDKEDTLRLVIGENAIFCTLFQML